MPVLLNYPGVSLEIVCAGVTHSKALKALRSPAFLDTMRGSSAFICA